MSTEKDQLAKDVVAHMMRHDLFSQWLGIEVLNIQEGYSKIQMTLRQEMINGFNVVHGGVAFSLADSAFAFACNNRNNLSMALDTNITFTKTMKPGDVLVAEAKELHNGKSTGLYLITVTNQSNEHVDSTVLLDIAAIFNNDLSPVAAEGAPRAHINVFPYYNIARYSGLRMNKGRWMCYRPDAVEFVKHKLT